VSAAPSPGIGRFLRRVGLSFVLLTALAGLSAPALSAPMSTDGRPGHGSLVTTVSKTDAILNARSLTPGGSVTGEITIANAGTLAARHRLSASMTGSRRLGETLRLLVRAANGRHEVVFDGALAALHRAPLGVLGAGESRTYVFRINLPSTHADNSLQGLLAGASFTWSAVAA
jgi:hypothetical protein